MLTEPELSVAVGEIHDAAALISPRAAVTCTVDGQPEMTGGVVSITAPAVK